MTSEKLRDSLSRIDYRLFAVLVLMGLLPTVYTTVRIYFLGSLPADWGYNIASQLTWLNVTYEVVHESLMLPMFFLIGRFLTDAERFSSVVSNGFLLIGSMYGLLMAFTLIFARPMIVFMAQKPELLDATVSYIRLEAIGQVLATFVRYFVLVLIALKRDRHLLLILACQVALSVLFDTFFLSSLPFSLRLGVNGIAYTNIIVNLMLTAALIVILHHSNVRLFGKGFALDGGWFRDWFKVGGLSGLESLVRNAAFVLMVVRLVNVVQQQGIFWVTNNFIWGWLLVPVLALGELTKRDTAASEHAILSHGPGYLLITGVVVLFWFATVPVWEGFIHTVMGVTDSAIVFRLSLLSVGFYVLFAFNNVADSVFYGRGRTDLMLYQSLIVNTVFYGAVFLFYQVGLFVPTLTKITLMFGVGIGLDSVITFAMFIRFRRHIAFAS